MKSKIITTLKEIKQIALKGYEESNNVNDLADLMHRKEFEETLPLEGAIIDNGMKHDSLCDSYSRSHTQTKLTLFSMALSKISANHMSNLSITDFKHLFGNFTGEKNKPQSKFDTKKRISEFNDFIEDDSSENDQNTSDINERRGFKPFKEREEEISFIRSSYAKKLIKDKPVAKDRGCCSCKLI